MVVVGWLDSILFYYCIYYMFLQLFETQTKAMEVRSMIEAIEPGIPALADPSV